MEKITLKKGTKYSLKFSGRGSIYWHGMRTLQKDTEVYELGANGFGVTLYQFKNKINCAGATHNGKLYLIQD